MFFRVRSSSMVRGDRRSSRRHKAKGGGTKGKGGGGNDGLGAGFDGSTKSGGAKLTAKNGDKFHFGGCLVEGELHQVTGSIDGLQGDTKLDGVNCGTLKSLDGSIGLMEACGLQIGPHTSSSTPISCGFTSWALEVDASEALDRNRESSGGGVGSVCALDNGNLQRGEVLRRTSQPPLMARTESSKVDIPDSPQGNALDRAAYDKAHDRDLNSRTTGMDCDDRSHTPSGTSQGPIHGFLECVSDTVGCWKSENFGKIGCTDGTFTQCSQDCTQGVCPLASTAQCTGNACEETGLVDGRISAPNSRSFSPMAATNSLSHGPIWGSKEVENPVKNLREAPKPNLVNAWKKPIHVKVNSLELGEITKNGRSVAFDRTSYEKNKCRLEKGLVGKLIGRRLPLNILDRELSRRWGHVGGFRTVLIGGDCFLCIFESIEARDNILMGGPWQIMGHIIGMDRWTPEFNPDSLKGLSSPVWVRLPRLPLLFWDNVTIGRIATMLGEPLWIDALTANTAEWGMSEYARICVRMDLSKKLPTGVWIEGERDDFFQPVEYEGISMLCFHCGIVGHKVDYCPNLVNCTKLRPIGDLHTKDSGYGIDVRGRSTNEVGESSSRRMTESEANNTVRLQEQTSLVNRDTTTSVDGDYGPWILVTKRKRPPPKTRNLSSHNSIERVAPKATILQSPQVTAHTNSLVEGIEVMAPIVMNLDKRNECSKNMMTSAEMEHHIPNFATPKLPHSRSGKCSISKAHFEKELLQLGPITLKS